MKTSRGDTVRCIRLALISAVCLILTGLPPARTAASVAELPYRLQPAMTSSVAPEQAGLVADGSLIVWSDSRTGTPDIYAYDLDDNREFRVARTASFRVQPAISDAQIVWVTGSDPRRRTIDGLDLSRGTPLEILKEPGEVSDPAIDSGWVVWRQRSDGRWDIRARRLSDEQIIRLTDDPANQAYPAISGSTVVWQDFRNGNWDIYAYDLETGQARAVTATPDDETHPSISGEWLVFCRRRETGGPQQVVLMNLRTNEEKPIVADHAALQPSVADGVVAWQDWRTGLPDIYAYDIEHDQIFAIARSQQTDEPAVSDRGVAWISRSDLTRGRVQAISFVPRLPTDPRDPPAVPSPDHVYVPETKHFMSAGFKSFWQSHGGPRLLGYPLTEEFTERDPTTGEEIIVQYFERVKLEYHPSAPEGERIMLARLGAELTAERHFEPIAPFESTSDRIYFPETGHSLAHGFKEFWEANGGLELFGFPISEEFTENGRTVQYFERARFEFNPDAGDDQYKVTLGLLGQEALQRKGWLPTPPIDTTMLSE